MVWREGRGLAGSVASAACRSAAPRSHREAARREGHFTSSGTGVSAGGGEGEQRGKEDGGREAAEAKQETAVRFYYLLWCR